MCRNSREAADTPRLSPLVRSAPSRPSPPVARARQKADGPCAVGSGRSPTGPRADSRERAPPRVLRHARASARAREPSSPGARSRLFLSRKGRRARSCERIYLRERRMRGESGLFSPAREKVRVASLQLRARRSYPKFSGEIKVPNFLGGSPLGGGTSRDAPGTRIRGAGNRQSRARETLRSERGRCIAPVAAARGAIPR